MIIWGGKGICLGKQLIETKWLIETKGIFIVTDPKVHLPHLVCSRMSFLVLIHHFHFLLCVHLCPLSLERGSHVIYSGLATIYATEDDFEVFILLPLPLKSLDCRSTTMPDYSGQVCHSDWHPDLGPVSSHILKTHWGQPLFSPFPNSSALLSYWNSWGIL